MNTGNQPVGEEIQLADYTIAIATCQRPAGLERVLRGLAGCRLPTPRCTVLVVDNDPQGGAAALVQRLAATFPLPLAYRAEPRPGVVHARNLALAHARARRLAFIDDDEEPTTGWLAALAAVMDATGAAAVSGPVQPRFTTPLPDWHAAAFALCYVRPLPDGSLRELMAGNLLLDLDFLHRHGLAFPAALATHGAEDTALSGLLTGAGGRLAWAPDAVVHEHIGADRLGLAWLLARWYRYGMSDVRIRLLENPGAATRLAALGRGAVRVAAGALLGLVALPAALGGRPAPAVRRCYTLLRGLGMIAGGLGLPSEPYAARRRRG